MVKSMKYYVESIENKMKQKREVKKRLKFTRSVRGVTDEKFEFKISCISICRAQTRIVDFIYMAQMKSSAGYKPAFSYNSLL